LPAWSTTATDLPEGVVTIAEALDQLAAARPALSGGKVEGLEECQEEETDAP
jgi:hypothetical protein